MRMVKQIGAAAVGGALAFAAPAFACGVAPAMHPSSWEEKGSNHLRQVDLLPDDPIVGMWSVQFTANGSQFDFGYQQWHADHTEVLNSGGRPPATQNFCLGVWARSGARYVLNHYALSYDPASGKLNGRVNIREEVALDTRGGSYAGSFTLTVVDPVRNTVLQKVTGNVTGRRVTVESGLVP
jgi:hypothetical protein